MGQTVGAKRDVLGVLPPPILQDILPDLVLVEVAAQEFDGLSQALLEGVLRRPAGQFPQLGGVSQQAVDLALFGAQALGLADDGGVGVDLGDQLMGQIADGVFHTGGDVQFPADGGVAVRDGHEAVGGVLDVVEVPGGGQAAQLDFGLAGQQLGDDGGDDGPPALAGAVGVEGPHDGDRQVKAALEALSQTVSADLGGGIGALALVGVLFVDGHILGGAVDLAGGGDQHPLGAQFPGGVEDVQGALDVGVHIAVGAVVGERDGNERRQVEHPLLPAHSGAHTVGVAHVAHKNIDLIADFFGQGVDPAQGPEGIVQAESADFLAAFDQFLGQVAADKTVCAGDHYGMCHGVLLLSTGRSPGITI